MRNLPAPTLPPAPGPGNTERAGRGPAAALRLRLASVAGAALLLAVLVPPAAAQVSTFSQGAEGWDVVDVPVAGPYSQVLFSYGLSWSSTGGYPDACVRRGDPSIYAFYFRAPAEFLGDQAGLYGSLVQYDLRIDPQGPLVPSRPDVVLAGAGLVLVVDSPVVPKGSWTHFMIDFDPAAGWQVGDLAGPAATAEQLQAVLGDVQLLLVCGDHVDGVFETTYLDNVRFGQTQGQLGDLNCDGVVDAFDIGPFVVAVSDPLAYFSLYPKCDIQHADINQDSMIDAFDIDPFVALLLGK